MNAADQTTPRRSRNRRWGTAAALLLLAGCTLNATRPLPAGAPASEGRAVVVFGVGMDAGMAASWNFPLFGVELDEYSPQTQQITGNCFRFNRVNASVPATQNHTQYFAFDVAPGYYIYSPFNGASLDGQEQAYAVSAGQVAYIGDFIYSKKNVVELRRNPETMPGALAQALPGLPAGVTPAQTIPARRPGMFLCTP